MSYPYIIQIMEVLSLKKQALLIKKLTLMIGIKAFMWCMSRQKNQHLQKR